MSEERLCASLSDIRLPPPSRMKLFHGTSKVRCRGKCVQTRDCGMGHGVMVMIALPISLFCIFVAADIHASVVGGALIFYVLMYAVVLLGTNTDPGVCTPSLTEPPLQVCEEAAGEPRSVRGMVLNPHDVIELVGPHKDNVYIRRYCFTCKIVRPPQSSHCPTCDYCVRGFDHHCGVLGICVGQRTWRYFTLFVCLAWLSCLYVFAFSLYFLISTFTDNSYGKGRRECSIGLMIFTGCVGCSLSGLVCHYLYLSAVNKTIRDEHHGLYSYYDSAVGNPFDEGCPTNCWIKMCRTTPSEVV